MRGTCVKEERTRLIKGDIIGNPNVTSNWIPTTISLTLRVITKKDIGPTVSIALFSHETEEGQR
jgi:hypothetical protein